METTLLKSKDSTQILYGDVTFIEEVSVNKLTVTNAFIERAVTLHTEQTLTSHLTILENLNAVDMTVLGM